MCYNKITHPNALAFGDRKGDFISTETAVLRTRKIRRGCAVLKRGTAYAA